MNNFYFNVSEQAINLGIKVLAIQIKSIDNSSYNEEFEEYKNKELEKIKDSWKDKKPKEDSVLKGFHDLHEKVGRSNRKYIASPEVLTDILLTRDKFPKINQLVDIYNLFSLKSKLALGAHDISKINTGVTLKLTSGNETFIPLGKVEREVIIPGEYGYIDEDNKVICRLEVIQCEQTKVTTRTREIFLLIQGNDNVEIDYIKSALEETCECIKKYCGGEVIYL